jgi:hypothetical protein
LNERIGNRDFETAEAEKALTCRGQEIATGMAKSGIRRCRAEARPRIASRNRRWYRQRRGRQLKSKKKQRWIYT